MSLSLRLLSVVAVLIVSWPFAAAADPIAEARRAEEAGQHRRAIEIVRPLAEKGDPRAQHMLGNLYWDSGTRSGLSDKEEKRRARIWFEKSAAQNYKPAIRDLGNVLLGGDPSEAQRGYDMLLGLARAGDTRAQAALGHFIAFEAGKVTPGGFRVPGTAADGLKWLERAADQKELFAVDYLYWWHLQRGKSADAYFWQIVVLVMHRSYEPVRLDLRNNLTKNEIASIERRAATWLDAHGYKFRRPTYRRR